MPETSLAADATVICSALGSDLPPASADHPLMAAADRLAVAADDPDNPGPGIRALFAGVIEPLCDGFSRSGRECYAVVFARILWTCCQRHPRLANALAEAGITSADALQQRYAALLNSPSPAPENPQTILVLSRVTVGADVLLTTIVLQHLHQRYPSARLIVAGDGKLQDLIGTLPMVCVEPLRYTRRGPLGERLDAWLVLKDLHAAVQPELIVSADSRLDQLGMLPLAPSTPYWWWGTLRDASHADTTLAQQLDATLAQTFGTATGITPSLGLAEHTTNQARSLQAALGTAPIAAVKFDHGGNPAKSLPQEAECLILKTLADTGWRILLDRGFGHEELAASDALMSALGWTAHDISEDGSHGSAIADLGAHSLSTASAIRFYGSIAGWAASVGICQLAISYDSVGQHLAAALHVPTIVIFTGHPHADFATAWTPARGPDDHCLVIDDGSQTDPTAWQRVLDALPQPPTNR